MTTNDEHIIVARVRQCLTDGRVSFTQHARFEMAEESMSVEEITQAISNALLVENYPDHRRGPCCLLSGETEQRRPIHLVCTPGSPDVIVITVYEPILPKWIDPFTRWRRT